VYIIFNWFELFTDNISDGITIFTIKSSLKLHFSELFNKIPVLITEYIPDILPKHNPASPIDVIE
jgi:hypothetical protein